MALQKKDAMPDTDVKNLQEVIVTPKEKKSAEWERDHEMVTGTFKFFDIPGGQLSFTFRKYKEPILSYTMVDGRQYSVPRMVADHLNNNCCHPTYAWQNDKFGSNIQNIVTYEHRTAFYSTDFGTQPSLIRAEIR